MAKNAATTPDIDDLTNTSKTSTFSKEEVAVTEITPKCSKMLNLKKVMGDT